VKKLQIVIVTGATSGIGRAAALRFGREEWNVLAVGRDAEALDRLRAEIGASGGRCEALTGDLTDPEVCAAAARAAIAHFGELHALVNAAGIIASGSVETTVLEEGDYMMAVNVRAPLVLMQAAIPFLAATRGSVVNVSSVAGLRAFPNLLVYCVSKAALDQLTRCAALDLAPKGVRVNAVNPGVVVTNLHRRSGMTEEAYAAFLEHSKTTHPLGRAGTADEIADLIFYLASDRAGWITGETISIDGGRHLTCAR
jgi:NAD(P)-dependent dehydrogenase (short-subunit alcohol dehydrogenase family)